MKRLNFLLRCITAFPSFEALKVCTDAGYVPTILGKSKRHGELIRALRDHGIKVWTGV